MYNGCLEGKYVTNSRAELSETLEPKRPSIEFVMIEMSLDFK